MSSCCACARWSVEPRDGVTLRSSGRAKFEWLRRYVPLANGVPVDDTIARIISALSVRGFQDCFVSWMEDAVKLSEGEIIALDGKTHRRSHDRKRGVKALHMVSAWACRNGVVLGQVKTEEKSNEITAVPELLEKLELSGCIVTLDAMGCQRAIAKQVKEGGGDYVLTLKGNQPQLEREVRGYFEAAGEEDFDRPEIENEETSEEGFPARCRHECPPPLCWERTSFPWTLGCSVSVAARAHSQRSLPLHDVANDANSRGVEHRSRPA